MRQTALEMYYYITMANTIYGDISPQACWQNIAIVYIIYISSEITLHQVPEKGCPREIY